MTASQIGAVREALTADLAAAFGPLTPDKAVAFFPGIPVDGQIVQNGVVNTLRLAQWLATFDTAIVLQPGRAQPSSPPGGPTATGVYSTVVNAAQALDPNSAAGKVLTKRIAADRQLLEQVIAEEPLGCEPSDWPLTGSSGWLSDTSEARSRPDPADPANTIVRLPHLDGVPDGRAVTIATWVRSAGDTVQVGEPLLEVSTDKADAEVLSPAAGTVLEITAPVGATVEPNMQLAVVGPGPAPSMSTVQYQYMVVSLTRRVSGAPWWDDLLLSDTTWYVPGRTNGGLLPPSVQGMASSVPYAILLIRDVVVTGAGQPPADMTPQGLLPLSGTGSGTDGFVSSGWSGVQAIGLIATILPPLPPNDDPNIPPNTLVTVPDFFNDTVAAARAQATSLGLDLSVIPATALSTSDAVDDNDVVVNQSPIPGKRIARGSVASVLVTVSTVEPGSAAATIQALDAAGVDFSVSASDLTDWLNDSDSTPYPAVAAALLLVLAGHRVRRPVYIDVIEFDYEQIPGITSPRRESDVKLPALMDAVVAAYNDRYGAGTQRFDELLEPSGSG